jgi:hypothetical protein
MTGPAENAISKALYALGEALADHNHQWSDELRASFEAAERLANGINVGHFRTSWAYIPGVASPSLMIEVRTPTMPDLIPAVPSFKMSHVIGGDAAIKLRDELLQRYPLEGTQND